jgi:hypothetical protein
MQAHGRAREAVLLGDGEKGFELAEFHGIPPECRDQGSEIRKQGKRSAKTVANPGGRCYRGDDSSGAGVLISDL